MEKFFAGLVRIDRKNRPQEETKALLAQPDYRSRQFVWLGEAELAVQQKIACPECNELFLLRDRAWENIVYEKKAYPCPDRHNKMLLEDVTTFRIPEIRPCPCCAQAAQQAKTDADQGIDSTRYGGTFNAGLYRLLVSSEPSQDIPATCFHCIARGGLGQIGVFNVSPPEVLVLGLDKVHSILRESAESYLKFVESKADVNCFVLSGPNAPKSLVVTNNVRSLVVIVFLSDEYIKDQLSRRDFTAALRSPKHVIPVLLPGMMTDGSFGWTGARDHEYWKEATKISEDWKHLSLFSALEFPAVNHQHIEFTMNVAQQIESHIQRPGKVSYHSDFSLLGVRLSYFHEFVLKNGGPAEFENLTTDDVMKKFVKPLTKESKLSYCEFLQSTGKVEIVGTADWFFSHAWKFKFLDVVDAMQRSFQNEDPFIWFDVFSVSQHKSEGRSFEWWNTIFLNAVGDIGQVMMMMQPYKNGDLEAWFTLTRVWCVFELLACELTQSKFEITMTREMHQRLIGGGSMVYEEVIKSLEAIDCENSTAGKEEDRHRVFEVIRKSVGFNDLNAIVKRKVKEWLDSSRPKGCYEKTCQVWILLTSVTLYEVLNQTRKKFIFYCLDRLSRM